MPSCGHAELQGQVPPCTDQPCFAIAAACLAAQHCRWNQAFSPRQPCLCRCKAQKQADGKVPGAAALLASPQGHHPWVQLTRGNSSRQVARLLVFLAFDQNPPVLLKRKGCEGRKGRRGPCTEWKEKLEWGPSLLEGRRSTSRWGPWAGAELAGKMENYWWPHTARAGGGQGAGGLPTLAHALC